MKVLITSEGAKLNKLYDKIFQIIDKNSLLFKIDTEKEYQTAEGYILEFDSLPTEAAEKIEELKHVQIIEL